MTIARSCCSDLLEEDASSSFLTNMISSDITHDGSGNVILQTPRHLTSEVDQALAEMETFDVGNWRLPGDICHDKKGDSSEPTRVIGSKC